MRTLTAILTAAFGLSICVSAQPTPKTSAFSKDAPRDALLFRNGDVLLGRLASIDRESGIRWSRPDALNAFEFSPDGITQLELAPQKTPELRPTTNLCSVLLNNGDQIQGDLVSYDGSKVTLDTWFAGRLEMPNSAVAVISPLGLPKPTLFAGPVGMEGWTRGKVNAQGLTDAGEWMYSNGAFYALKSASIARDLKLPDVASIQFDLEWRGFFHVAVALYSSYLHPINLANKEGEPQFGGFYSMQLNPFSANLLPVEQNEPLRYLGQASLQHLAQTNAAHVDIRVNKSKSLIALLINGALVKQWTDDGFAGTGTGVRFVHQGQGAVKLSNIKVSEWDGVFEEPAVITPNKTQDLARLKNGDRVIGAVKSIRDGKLSIEAGGRVLDVPITRVKQVELMNADPVKAKTSPQSVRAYFTSGTGSLTFDLERWADGAIAARSDNFGFANIKPEAFSRVLFDLTGAEPQPPSGIRRAEFE
ncbi:MAG TPA: hypothetical protein VF773_18840 [Verrucomicrobiae bacterium]